MKTKMVIDTDIGTDVDDLFALAYAFKNPKIDVKGISVVHGATKIRAMISLKLERMLGKNIPIMIGAEGDSRYWCGFEHLALDKKEINEPINDSEGYPKKPLTYSLYDERGEREFYDKDTKLVCIGPLTNIQSQLSCKHGIDNVKKVYLMGEKITSHNFIVDPYATGKVFSQPWEKYLITKEVSKKISFTKDELEKFRGNKLGDFIYDSAERWFNFYKGCNNTAVMYDALAVSAAADEGFVKFKKANDVLDDIFVSYDVELKFKDKLGEVIFK
jgi:purine nucleosidase